MGGGNFDSAHWAAVEGGKKKPLIYSTDLSSPATWSAIMKAYGDQLDVYMKVAEIPPQDREKVFSLISSADQKINSGSGQ